ncbi:stage V sporulation protein SpoVM [Alicyclobacillus curvatus]|nr:stage V sporulation protein SpoVM [Alicyclobacillus curvatus]
MYRYRSGEGPDTLRIFVHLTREGTALKFYTIKLPRFLGGIVKACIGVFSKD